MTINLTITNKQMPDHNKAVDIEAWEGGKKTLLATLGGGQSTDVVLYDGRTLQMNERALGVAATNPEAVEAPAAENASTEAVSAPQEQAPVEAASAPQGEQAPLAEPQPEVAGTPGGEGSASATAASDDAEAALADEQPQAAAA